MNAGLNIFWCQIGIVIPDNVISSKSCFKEFKDKVNHNPCSLNAGLAMAYIWIYFYTLIHCNLSPTVEKVIKIDCESQGQRELNM